MIQLEPVISAIQKELWSFFSTEAHTSSDILRYINSANNYIASFRDFPYLIKTQTVVYTTPAVAQTITYCLKVIGINGDTSINVIPQQDWFFPDNRVGAICVDGDQFIATESWTYTIMYVSKPTTVTSTSTTIDIPPQFEPVLIDIAIHYGYKDIKLYDKSSAKIGQANNELNLLAQRITNTTPRQQRRFGANYRI